MNTQQWKDFLSRATAGDASNVDWFDAKEYSGQWRTCAVGALHPAVAEEFLSWIHAPEGSHRAPLSPDRRELNELGTGFYDAIENEDADGASAVFEQIEAWTPG